MPKGPFNTVALLLQVGGGALGAYQAGVYEALNEAGVEPDWVTGISIGAINAAIIAGNAPKARVGKLREFWEEITARPGWDWFADSALGFADSSVVRQSFNQVSAGLAALMGTSGFFSPRIVPPWLQPDGTLDATSYYDTGPLRETLSRLVDFKQLNAGGMRFSAGAVNVRSGNFAYFDTASQAIDVNHVLASGALPPGFPAVEIDREYYWDGGLVSNTPLQWALESSDRARTRWLSKSTCGAPAGVFRRTSRKSARARRRFSIPAARARTRTSSRTLQWSAPRRGETAGWTARTAKNKAPWHSTLPSLLTTRCITSCI